MRVLQLIDSLRPGGAEKMAVNIANALLPHVEGSYLCCTREEGLLKGQIKGEVGFLFLNKKGSLDPGAIIRLRKYIAENEIHIVHAHSTSFFLAGLLKLTGSSFKLFWHDHYGNSDLLYKRNSTILKGFSRLFAGVISVNSSLKEWAVEHLECEMVTEMANFIPEPISCHSDMKLKGLETDFKIICVANLRPQKDHFNLLKAFEMVDSNLSISLHLIGEDTGTPYSASFLEAIKNSHVKHKIYYYGTQPEIIHLLKQADLGVLSSKSEGLPLALLEYAFAGLPVVCTKVGKCAEVIGKSGILIEKENSELLKLKIMEYKEHPSKMKEDAANFKEEIKNKYSEKKFLTKLIEIYSR